jgi:chromosome segregation ATPase
VLHRRLSLVEGQQYRTTQLEEAMATVAEQVTELLARATKVDADLTRRNEREAALTARVAELETQLGQIVPEEQLAALLEPVKAALADLDDRTPEPVAAPVDEDPADPAV